MRDGTRREVEQWWRDVFDVHDTLWSKVTVRHPHGLLGDYAGWYVAWRDAGVHVSAPPSAQVHDVASLTHESASTLQDVTFWRAFAKQRGLELIGPSVHRYLDEDPGPARGVREVAPSELRALGDQVEVEDWWECGFDESLDEPGVVAFAAEGGGAVLRELDGAPRNVTLLVVPEARGRGLGTELGRAAASYAVRHHGYARWRSRDTNIASTRAAQRLGFESYATQLAVRSGSSPA
jgi:RimJ/RimL family protein N-acetyltransferase